MNVFLNLDSSDFLIEYIYYDTSSPEIISTDDAPFYWLQNGHTKDSSLLNRDGLESITNNTRNRSGVVIDSQSKKYALLTTNKLGQVYNDYDPLLTETENLPLEFSNQEGIYYDTVRVHFIQGFSFNDFFSAINLNIKVKDKTSKYINLLDNVFKVQDNYQILNPNPFLYSGRQYSTYIEFKVPSLRYLIDSYKIDYIQDGNSDILSYKITNGQGFYENALIEISAGKMGNISKRDNQFFTTRISSEATSISSKDDFSEVGVFIEESKSGDYIEFYGTYNGEIFGDYIQRLNTSGTGNYIAIHKLLISEQLPNTTGDYNIVGKYNPLTNIPDLSNNTFLSNFKDGDYWVATETGYNSTINQNVNKGNFVVYNPNLPGTIKVDIVDSYSIDTYSGISQILRTGDQEFIQDSNFEDPNNFRPVLNFGGSALSFKIDYTLQIFNTNTNATITKTGTYVSYEPNKYGKELLKLNTRDNIQVFDIFNKKVINNIVNTNTVDRSSRIQDTSLYSKNLTSFKQINNVYSGVTEVSINSEGKIVPSINPDSSENIKGQGTATVYISPFDTFLQFGIYEQIENGTFRSIDLSKIGQVFMNFTNKEGEIIKISNTNNQNVDFTKGQVLFRVNSGIYNQIINSGNNVFFITSKVGDNSPETPIYTGKYKDYASITDDETELLINQQRQTISNLNKGVESLESRISQLEDALEEARNTGNVKPIVERVLGPTAKKQTKGQTADNKKINKQALNIKTSTFNPFGPTARNQRSVSPTSR